MIKSVCDHLRKYFSQEGFTLVEVIISMVLVGLLASYLLPVINNTYLGIINTGKSRLTLYNLQEQLESSISDAETSSETPSDSISITIPGQGALTVTGSYIIKESGNIKLTAFIAKKN